MKLLTTLTTVLVLAWASTRWAQTYAKMGDSCTTANANGFTGADNDVMWMVDQTPTSYVYTAVTGDTVILFRAWTSQGDSISFGLYEFDLVGDTPTVRVYVDTAVFATTSEWHSLTGIAVALTPGKSYVSASANIGAINMFYKAEATGTDSTVNQVTPTEWPSAFSTTNDEYVSHNQWCVFALVAQYGGAGPSPSLAAGGNAAVGGSVWGGK